MSWTHFFDSHFSRIAGNDVCFSTACKNDGVTMSWKDQHVRMSWKDLCFRMFWKVESLQMYVTHFFPGYFSAFPGTAFVTGVLGKTMVSRCLPGKNLCGYLANTSVSECLRVCFTSA